MAFRQPSEEVPDFIREMIGFSDEEDDQEEWVEQPRHQPLNHLTQLESLANFGDWFNTEPQESSTTESIWAMTTEDTSFLDTPSSVFHGNDFMMQPQPEPSTDDDVTFLNLEEMQKLQQSGSSTQTDLKRSSSPQKSRLMDLMVSEDEKDSETQKHLENAVANPIAEKQGEEEEVLFLSDIEHQMISKKDSDTKVSKDSGNVLAALFQGLDSSLGSKTDAVEDQTETGSEPQPLTPEDILRETMIAESGENVKDAKEEEKDDEEADDNDQELNNDESEQESGASQSEEEIKEEETEKPETASEESTSTTKPLNQEAQFKLVCQEDIRLHSQLFRIQEYLFQAGAQIKDQQNKVKTLAESLNKHPVGSKDHQKIKAQIQYLQAIVLRVQKGAEQATAHGQAMQGGFLNHFMPKLTPENQLKYFEWKATALLGQMQKYGDKLEDTTKKINELYQQLHTINAENKTSSESSKQNTFTEEQRKHISKLSPELRKLLFQKEQLLAARNFLNHQLQSTRQFLRKVKSVVEPPTPWEHRRKAYNNLMTPSDKHFLNKIQLKQLQSDKPYVDDYYYNKLRQIKAQEQETETGEKQTVPIVRPDAEPHRLHSSGKYTPAIEIGASLGNLRSFDIRAPQMRLDTRQIVHEDSQLDSGLAAARKQRIQALALVEKTYSQLLAVEDIDLRAQIADDEEKKELFEARSKFLDDAAAYLNFTAPGTPLDGAQTLRFFNIMNLSKALRAIARLIPVFESKHLAMFCSSFLKTLPVLTSPAVAKSLSKDNRNILSQELMPNLIQHLPRMNLEDITAVFKDLIDYIPNVDDLGLHHFNEFGVGIHLSLLSIVDKLMSQNPQQSVRNAWIQTLEEYSSKVLPLVKGVLVSEKTVKDGFALPYVWTLATILSSRAGKDMAIKYRDELKDVLKSTSYKEAASQFESLISSL